MRQLPARMKIIARSVATWSTPTTSTPSSSCSSVASQHRMAPPSRSSRAPTTTAQSSRNHSTARLRRPPDRPARPRALLVGLPRPVPEALRPHLAHHAPVPAHTDLRRHPPPSAPQAARRGARMRSRPALPERLLRRSLDRSPPAGDNGGHIIAASDLVLRRSTRHLLSRMGMDALARIAEIRAAAGPANDPDSVEALSLTAGSSRSPAGSSLARPTGRSARSCGFPRRR